MIKLPTTCPHCNGTGNFTGNANSRLMYLRKAAGETQETVADALGVTRPQLANIEGGRSHLTASTLFAASKHFSVSADWILGLTDKGSEDDG